MDKIDLFYCLHSGCLLFQRLNTESELINSVNKTHRRDQNFKPILLENLLFQFQ